MQRLVATRLGAVHRMIAAPIDAPIMQASGGRMATVSQHLGHESIQTTVGLYVHLDRTSMQAVAETMDRLVGDRL